MKIIYYVCGWVLAFIVFTLSAIHYVFSVLINALMLVLSRVIDKIY